MLKQQYPSRHSDFLSIFYPSRNLWEPFIDVQSGYCVNNGKDKFRILLNIYGGAFLQKWMTDC